MDKYSHHQLFNLYDNPEQLEQSIKDFIKLGWINTGQVSIVGAPFHCVSWPKGKGQPVYPSSYRK